MFCYRAACRLTHVVPAQDPHHIDAYLAHSTFLADANNERSDARVDRYRTNLLSLEKLVLYRFADDHTGW